MKTLILVSMVVTALPLLGIGVFFVRARADAEKKIERFAPHPPTPNCASSELQPDDPRHFPPLPMTQTKTAVVQTIKTEVAAMDGATLVVLDDTDSASTSPRADDASNAYLHFEFRSRFFGFVDDVEFHVDSGAKLVRLRSASRTGRYDFEANRKRLETIRDRIQEKI